MSRRLPGDPAAANDPPRAARTLAEAEGAQAQLVTVRRPEGVTVARGSAFFVDAYGHLLTCAHVLDHMPKDESPRLRLRDGRERRFSVVTVDRETDLAVLLSDPPPYFLALAEATMPSIGQAVLLAGFAARPLDLDTAVRLTRGTVVSRERRWATGVRRTVGSRRRIVTVKIDPIADAGQSGGPRAGGRNVRSDRSPARKPGERDRRPRRDAAEGLQRGRPPRCTSGPCLEPSRA